jgi:hypothetical protein
MKIIKNKFRHSTAVNGVLIAAADGTLKLQT